MIFGTFDGLHKGHENLFRQAKRLAKGAFLVASVARDTNVKKIKKISPVFSEKERLTLLKNYPLIDKAILGGLANHIPHIIREKPDIIALGYDQKAYIKGLKKELKEKGLDVEIKRLKPYKAHIYKNHILKQKK